MPDTPPHDNMQQSSSSSSSSSRSHDKEAVPHPVDEQAAQLPVVSNATSAIPPSSQEVDGTAVPTSPPSPTPGTSKDLEASHEPDSASDGSSTPLDIEHVPVEDDPRLWSSARKWTQVAIVSYGALIPTMGANMFFPALDDLRRELNASSTEISLSISLYILFQGSVPLLWSPISEIYGRKPCFLLGLILYTIATGLTSLATNMTTVIALRALAAAGSSCALSIAAGSLADMYEAEERGVVVGVYYCLPITGPAIAPIIGGALTEAAGWKATFYFLAAAGAMSVLAYACFKETFRTERSAAWQKAREQAIKRHQASHHAHSDSQTHSVLHDKMSAMVHKVKAGAEKLPTHLHHSKEATSVSQSQHPPMQVPEYRGPGLEYLYSSPSETHVERPPQVRMQLSSTATGQNRTASSSKAEPTGSAAPPLRPTLSSKLSRTGTRGAAAGRVVTRDGQEISFKPSLKDVSPHGSAAYVCSQPHNIAALLYSGINFAAQYSLSFTTTQTFTGAPYNFSPILVGCVLLALGLGGMVGSIIGGKVSDLRLRSVAKKLGHKAPPEERLRTVVIPMLCVIPAFIGYGWTLQEKTNVAAPVVLLLLVGYTQIHSYSATLSYMVDSNPGRSSGAVATNSCFRGVLACIASQVSSPILASVGNGPMQTGWGVLLALSTVVLLVVMQKGGSWRDEDWRWPRFWRREQWRRDRVGGAAWIQEKRRRQEEEKQSSPDAVASPR